MTILRSGSTKKYSDNWSAVFGGGKNKTTAKKSKSAKKKSAVKKKAKTKK